MQPSLPFAKFQGAGNDFVIVDGRPGRPAAGLDWAALAIAMCDRHYGVGADGILVAVIPATQSNGASTGAIAAAPGVGMRMFNPDGSESEMCGNGLRCFARWLADAGEMPSGAAAIATGAGVLHVTLLPDGTVAAGMGAPVFTPERFPVALADGTTLAATSVSMGNPHAVIFVDDVNSVPLEALGPQVEHHALFPRRTNVEFVQVLAADRLRVRVWERGAGITLACGTGACASMVAARLHGFIDSRATLELPGGNLDVQWDGAIAAANASAGGTSMGNATNTGSAGSAGGTVPEVILSGPATRVFDGVWRLVPTPSDGAVPSSHRTERAGSLPLVAAQKANSQW